MERGPLWEHQVFCAVAGTPEPCGRPRARRLAQRRNTGGAGAGAPAGAQLLTRSKTSVTLTPQGERYVESARDMLRLEEKAREGASAQPAQGRLLFRARPAGRVALPAAAALCRGLPRRAHRHQLYRQMGGSDRRDDRLRAAGFPASSELLGARLWPCERLRQPRLRGAHGTAREPEDLVRHRLIMHTGPRVLKDWHLRGEGPHPAAARGAGPARQHRQRLMALALAGTGVARLADWPRCRKSRAARWCVCPAIP